MKKSFIYLLLITALLTSCKQSENNSNSYEDTQLDRNSDDSSANEVSNTEDSDNVYQAPAHPCPECDDTIRPNEYDEISDDQYEKLKSSGFNYSKITWKMPGIWGYWYVSADCEVSFVKQNNAEGPFCKRCADSYCEKRRQAEAEESQNIEEEQQQQNKSREYPLCDWCDEEVKGIHYFIEYPQMKVTDDLHYYNDKVYHQNCANAYCNSRR